MRINTHLPWWAAVLIVSPQTAAVVYALVIKERDAEEFDEEPRKYGIGVGVICAVFTLLAGIRIGTYFFLVYLYGWERVRSEHLRFLSMPKGHAWPVSNGDRIADVHFLHYLISIGIWFALFLVIYPAVYRLLPRRD